jgi:hypothetical protein
MSPLIIPADIPPQGQPYKGSKNKRLCVSSLNFYFKNKQCHRGNAKNFYQILSFVRFDGDKYTF